MFNSFTCNKPLCPSQPPGQAGMVGRANSDPQGLKCVELLMLANLTVFLDYGHWGLVASLEESLLQSRGLSLYVGVTLWQMWTDEYLARHFHTRSPERSPMSRGPCRYIRPPRYAAAIVGCVLGWLLLLAWGTLFVRKVEVEQAHLKNLFGSTYEAYQRRTARLLPGIY